MNAQTGFIYKHLKSVCSSPVLSVKAIFHTSYRLGTATALCCRPMSFKFLIAFVTSICINIYMCKVEEGWNAAGNEPYSHKLVVNGVIFYKKKDKCATLMVWSNKVILHFKELALAVNTLSRQSTNYDASVFHEQKTSSYIVKQIF